MEEIKISSQAQALTSSSVEVATNFTIGMAVEQAAEEVRSFIQSQIPCAEVELKQATLTVKYDPSGSKNCNYRGQTYSGTHRVTLSKNDMDDVQVDHEWIDFKNQNVQVDGTATVTWDFDAKTRRVVHEANWVRLEDQRMATGSGDRTQEVLEGGLLEGIRVNGTRDWEGESGDWNLDIDNVEMRWVDTVPQSGKYKLDTPFDKVLTVSFERTGDWEVTVTIKDDVNSFDFKVITLPDV